MSQELPAPILTPYLIDEIEKLLKQKLSPLAISEKINIPLPVLKELFIKQRRERLLEKAESFSEAVLDIDIKKFNSSYEKALRLKQAEASFIRETLGKDLGYSKRSELTGKDGQAIHVKEIIFTVPVDPNTTPPTNDTPTGNKN